MADIEDVKDRISQISRRRRNVDRAEIEWVVNRLRDNGYEVSSRSNGHAVIFRVGTKIFSVCTHRRGARQLKPCYVDDFLDAMEESGLYEN
jgi:hypothetical protein